MSDQKNFVDAQITDLQSNLVTKGRNHESIRDKNLSLERQLEFAAIEISTVSVTATKTFYICHNNPTS